MHILFLIRILKNYQLWLREVNPLPKVAELLSGEAGRQTS